MKVEFKLDVKSVADFYANNIIKTKYFKRGSIAIYLYLLAILFIVVTLTNIKSLRIFVTVFIAIMIIFLRQFINIFYKYKFSKDFKKEKYKSLFNEREICINQENISIDNKFEKRYINFEFINSLNVFDGYLVIVLNNYKNSIIPLSAFSSLAEKDNFFKELESKTSKKIIYSYPYRLFISS